MRSYVERLSLVRDRIEENRELHSIRRDLLDLMTEFVSTRADSLGRWEKSHLATAIAALDRHIHHRHQPSSWWLRYCVQNLWKAQIAPSERSEHASKEDKLLDSLSPNDLLREIDLLRIQLTTQWQVPC